MPGFNYSAIDQKSGKELTGVVEGHTMEAVITTLKGRGLAPLDITPAKHEASAPKSTASLAPTKKRAPKPKRASKSISFGRILNAKELSVFTRQIGSLIRAGMPLLRSLEVLARQEKNAQFRDVLDTMGETIRSGGTFSQALQQHPKLFDRLYVNMIKAGEAGGVLDVVLDRLAQFLEKSVRVRGKIKSAMTYPLIIIIVATLIVAALMVFVVPKFEIIFATSLKGQSLPALTQAVIGVSSFLKNNIIGSIGIVVGGFFGIKLLARTSIGIAFLHRWQLRVPVMGDLFLKTAIARFTRTFGTLLSSGVPILEALRITGDTSGNSHVAAAIAVVHDRVKEGDSVAGPLRGTGVFPDMVSSMIEVGEETGDLPGMLTRVADGYDEEVDNSVNALTSLIEPLMIVVMAVMVGTIVIALFLPIVRIIQTLG